MKKNILIILTLLLPALVWGFTIVDREATHPKENAKVTVTILETTDIHGNIFPYDYFQGESDDRGLAMVSTLVRQYRAENPYTLLLDAGDLIQGTPLTFLFNHKHPEYPNPMIAVLNYMGYDAFAVGNHDIEQGTEVYDKCRDESNFPWLAANAVLEDGSTYFDPYWVTEIDGVRIGVLGMCTPGIPLWLNPELYPGIHFEDMVETAEKWIPALREREKVDVLVGLFHSGTNADYDAEVARKNNVPLPNASQLVAEEVPGFDVILTGHAHQVIPSQYHPDYIFNDVYIAQAGCWGYYLGKVDIDLCENEGHWQVEDIRVNIERVKGTPPDSTILEMITPYHEMTLNYTEEVIGYIGTPLSGASAIYEDTPLLDLVNNAQMWASGARVSFAANFNPRLEIQAGPLRVRDIYLIYRYENFLNLVEMSGSQIDAYLEYSANYFKQYPFVNEKMTEANIKYYNVDVAQGIDYVIDLNRRAGDRVEILGFSDGAAFHPDSVYAVALNSYRGAGGRGYMAAVDMKQNAITWKSAVDMRELIIEYLKNFQQYSISADNNWRIIPAEAVEQLKNKQ